jgi:hypothetical protein
MAVAAAGTALALGLALGRRLASPHLMAQVVGGLGCGLLLAVAAARHLPGGGHG